MGENGVWIQSAWIGRNWEGIHILVEVGGMDSKDEASDLSL